MQDELSRWLVERRALDSSFLDRVWPIVFGRTPDEEGRLLFLDKMSRGCSRLVVIEDLLTSAEYSLSKSDDATFCRHLYKLILSRDPHGEDTMTGWLELVEQKGRMATFQAFCTAPEVEHRFNLEDSWDLVETLAGRIMVTFRRFEARITFGVQRSPRPLVITAHNVQRIAGLLDEANFEALSFRLVNHFENPVLAPWQS